MTQAILINPEREDTIIALVYRKNVKEIEAKWNIKIVEKVCEDGHITALTKMTTDLVMQLLDIKMKAELRIRKQIAKQQDSKKLS